MKKFNISDQDFIEVYEYVEPYQKQREQWYFRISFFSLNGHTVKLEYGPEDCSPQPNEHLAIETAIEIYARVRVTDITNKNAYGKPQVIQEHEAEIDVSVYDKPSTLREQRALSELVESQVGTKFDNDQFFAFLGQVERGVQGMTQQVGMKTVQINIEYTRYNK